MRLRYGVLCDYAAPGAGNKPTAVGIFDAIHPNADGMFVLHGVLLASFDAPGSGPKRLLTIKLVDDDAKELFENETALNLAPAADGLGMGGSLYFGIPPFQLPGAGDYEIVFYADGVRFSSIDVHAVAPKTAPVA